MTLSGMLVSSQLSATLDNKGTKLKGASGSHYLQQQVHSYLVEIPTSTEPCDDTIWHASGITAAKHDRTYNNKMKKEP